MIFNINKNTEDSMNEQCLLKPLDNTDLCFSENLLNNIVKDIPDSTINNNIITDQIESDFHHGYWLLFSSDRSRTVVSHDPQYC